MTSLVLRKPSKHHAVIISVDVLMHSCACRLQCGPSVGQLLAARLPGVKVTAIALHECSGVRERYQALQLALDWQRLHVQHLHSRSS